MHGKKLTIRTARVALGAWLTFFAIAAFAQVFSPPEYFEKHFRYEATDARDGPKLRTQMDFVDYDSLITRSTVKFNNAGFEQHVALGAVQNIGNGRTAVTYNTRRFNYGARSTQRDDVTLDLHYGPMRAQHRFEDKAQISTVGMPFDLKIAHLDLSFSQTKPVDSSSTIDVYRIASRIKRLKFSVTFKETATSLWTDYLTEYRPTGRWMLKYAYRDNGPRMRREFRGEYNRPDYRIAGEMKSMSYLNYDAQVTSAVSLETDVKASTLKLRVEYSDYVDSPTFSLNFETPAFL